MGQVDTLAPLLKDMSCRQGLRIDFSKDQHHRDPEGCTKGNDLEKGRTDGAPVQG